VTANAMAAEMSSFMAFLPGPLSRVCDPSVAARDCAGHMC
jgi:hypothetical protein